MMLSPMVACEVEDDRHCRFKVEFKVVYLLKNPTDLQACGLCSVQHLTSRLQLHLLHPHDAPSLPPPSIDEFGFKYLVDADFDDVGLTINRASYSGSPAQPSTSSFSGTRSSRRPDDPNGAETTFGSDFRSSDDGLASDSPFGDSDDSVDEGDIQTLALKQFVRDYDDTSSTLPQPPPGCRVTALDLLRLCTCGLLNDFIINAALETICSPLPGTATYHVLSRNVSANICRQSISAIRAGKQRVVLAINHTFHWIRISRRPNTTFTTHLGVTISVLRTRMVS